MPPAAAAWACQVPSSTATVKARNRKIDGKPLSGSVAGAIFRSRRSRCSVWERCRSVLWPRQQQKQRPGTFGGATGSRCSPAALDERSGAVETSVAASESVGGVSCGSCSSRNNAQKRSVALQAGASRPGRKVKDETARFFGRTAGSVAEARKQQLQKPGCSVQERCRSVA